MDVAGFFVLLAEFFDQQFIYLMLGTVLLFLIMFVTWWVYKNLSSRNLFSITHENGSDEPGFKDYLLYVTKYFLFFPTLTFIGFLIFGLSLFLLIKPVDMAAESNILVISIIMISTIRMSAYVSEGMAEDLAKLVPLALLGVILTEPSAALSGIGFAQFIDFIVIIPSAFKYLVFIIILEVLLRGGTWLFTQLNSRGSSAEYVDEESEDDAPKRVAVKKSSLKKASKAEVKPVQTPQESVSTPASPTGEVLSDEDISAALKQ